MREGGLAGTDDTSADERFYNRSVKIRKGCFAFMGHHVGQLYDSWEDMASDAGNWIRENGYVKQAASIAACRRWLYQYGKPSAAGFCPWKIVSQPAGLVIMDR